ALRRLQGQRLRPRGPALRRARNDRRTCRDLHDLLSDKRESDMPNMKGGELIAQYLVQEKVPYIFGICGHGNVGILDALYDVKDQLKLVSPRHEQCAGHMADAYFRVKHKPVATLTSTGPGSANMVMSCATALSDSSAFL